MIHRPPGLPSVELHEARNFSHSYPRHWHDEVFLTAITGGEGIFRYGGTEHRARSGTLVFVIPGEVHSHSPGPGGRSFRSLHAGNTLVSALAPELRRLGGSDGWRSGSFSDPRLLGSFVALHRLLERETDLLGKETRLLGFFVGLVRRMPSPPAEPFRSCRERDGVRRAQEFLDDEGSSGRVSLRELAALAGMSPYHFHRLFRGQVGMPPHEYQIRRRVLRARILLREGRPAADVAAATGFADQSHLTRHFKRLLGVPPGDFSRRARSKNVQDPDARPD